MSGVRIEVDPGALIAAGRQLGSLGSQLGMLSDALGSALSSGIASGMDPAGLKFGIEYGRDAQRFANELANAANAFKSVGYRMEATGYNYKNADAASTIGGPGPVGGLGGEPSVTTAGDLSAGPNSAIVPPPFKWSLIQSFLTVVPGGGAFASAAWPSGNSAMMRLTAAQWRNFERGFAVFEPQLAQLKSIVAAQQTPETATIRTALDNLGQGMSVLANASGEMARLVEDFANTVQETQDAIRRLLDRLSLDGLWDTVKGIFTGEGDKILREVARDVSTVLENFQRQVKGVIGLLKDLATLVGDAATAFQKWIRPVLISVLGEDVGGAVADQVKFRTDLGAGLTIGLIGTVSSLVSLADPDTWEGLADLAASVAQDPSTLPGVLQTMGKNFAAWDEWSGENPGRAAGQAAFNIGSLFVPGGIIGGTARVTTSLGRAANAFDSTRGAVRPGVAPSPGGTPLFQGAEAGRGGERAPVVQQPSHGPHDTSSNKPLDTSNLETSAAAVESAEARERAEAKE